MKGESLAERWYPECRVCPHRCGVDRLFGGVGICGTDDGIYVASANLHFGEEPVLVGRGGSGTIFFSSCNLRCVFCQNYDISMCVHPREAGRRLSPEELEQLVWSLQFRGAENINLVTPTHMGPSIFDAIRELRAEGMRLPVVYNCGGYESVEFLGEIEGLVDIYMPDVKFGSDAAGARFTTAEDYFSRCREAVAEMHRQVGDLRVGPGGTAERGLLVRHLVMPGIDRFDRGFGESSREDGEAARRKNFGAADSDRVIDFIANEISRSTYLNIMDQYRPAYHARSYAGIGRRISLEEYEAVRRYAEKRGLSRFAD